MRVRFDDGNAFVLDAPGTVGADQVVTGLEGWHGVGARTHWEDRATDGMFGTDLWREGRQLTLAVTETFADVGSLTVRARAVAGVFRSGQHGGGTLTVDGPDGLLGCYEIGLDGTPKVDWNIPGLWIKWELPLRSPDPYLYGPELSTHVATANVGRGLKFPLFSDGAGTRTGVLEFGGSSQVVEALTNIGTQPAYPVVTVGGSFPAGFHVDLVGDGPDRWGVTYRGDVLMAEPVVVDFAGRVVSGGMDRSHLLTRRHWGGVEPGGTVSVSLSAVSSGSGWADLALSPTYL